MLLNILQCNISYSVLFFLFLITLIYFQGSEALQSIVADMRKMEEVEVHAQCFEMMKNLRMLMLYYSRFRNSWFRNESNVFRESSLIILPETLKILYWTGFPQRSLPPNFCPQNLVRLEMIGSHLEQLWEGDQVFQVIYVLCVLHF